MVLLASIAQFVLGIFITTLLFKVPKTSECMYGRYAEMQVKQIQVFILDVTLDVDDAAPAEEGIYIWEVSLGGRDKLYVQDTDPFISSSSLA